MKPLSFESREPITNPTEELARLRGVVAERHLDAEHLSAQAGKSESITEREAATDVINQYATTKPNEVLTPEFALKDHEATEIVLKLSPESHDEQMERLLGILEEHGIRNAMHVVEKMNNPHIYDDFHRLLVQFIASGHSVKGLKESGPLWKPLHMTLYEVSLPETNEEEKKKQLSELISGMEQFYAGMLSIVDDNKNPGWFTVEIANANGSDEFIFYVSVPTPRKGLFEKQIVSIFPDASAREHTDDYNIFNSKGAAVASYANLSKHPLYPLKSYDEFDVDPLNSILNAFSHVDKDGEGAAIQFIIGKREELYAKEGTKVIEQIRKGKKVSEALSNISQSVGGMIVKDVASMFKSKEQLDKDKEAELKRAQAIDQTVIEQFTHKLSSPFVATNIR